MFRYSIILGVAVLLLGSRTCFAQAEFVPKGSNGFGFSAGLGSSGGDTFFNGGIYFTPGGRTSIGLLIGRVGDGPEATSYGAQVGFLPLKPDSGMNGIGMKIDLGYEYDQWTNKWGYGDVSISKTRFRSFIPVTVSWFAQIKVGENTFFYPQLGVGRVFAAGYVEDETATLFKVSAPLCFGDIKGGLHLAPAIALTTFEGQNTFSLSFGWTWW